MYVPYGNGKVNVSQLSADGLSIAKTQQVLQASDVPTDSLEGNRMYKINGTYYILNDQPGSTTCIWKSSSPWGPYESKVLVQNMGPPVEGGNSPHQGSLIKTADGNWYYMSFTWAYPAGRMPVLAPVTWGADGFPEFVKCSNGGWGTTYPLPLPAQPLYNWTRTYNLETELGPTWEWNHNPDIASFEIGNSVTLRTASVTDDIYSARNTLTHRIHGEFPTGTVEIDFSGMADGDRFGLAAFRDQAAYVGIHRNGSAYTLAAVQNITMDEYSGDTVGAGQEVAPAPVPAGAARVWFRAELDARASGTRAADFFYSFDGVAFTRLGPTFGLLRNPCFPWLRWYIQATCIYTEAYALETVYMRIYELNGIENQVQWYGCNLVTMRVIAYKYSETLVISQTRQWPVHRVEKRWIGTALCCGRSIEILLSLATAAAHTNGSG